MDHYRALNGPDLACKTWHFLGQILQAGEPPIKPESYSVHQLQARDLILFFPESAIIRILKDGRNPVQTILSCTCRTCITGQLPLSTELDHLAERILTKPCLILLAILIYIGHGHLIKLLALEDRVSDQSLDTVTTYFRNEENLEARRLLASGDVEAFCRIYDSAKDLFQPPKIVLGGPTIRYGSTFRMPFLKDQHHAQGSSGEVRRFNVHEDYLDRSIQKEEWYRSARSEVSGMPI